MKERPILFSAPMVRALLKGTKTQTRRMVKPQPEPGCIGSFGHGLPFIRTLDRTVSCPYGKIGDRLWVRETWAPNCHHDHAYYRADCVQRSGCWILSLGDSSEMSISGWKPSIHMPRWASRILLEITDVRVERLIDITQADCKAEGCPGGPERDPTPRTEFRALWESINGAESWRANPWVWALTFRRLP